MTTFATPEQLVEAMKLDAEETNKRIRRMYKGGVISDDDIIRVMRTDKLQSAKQVAERVGGCSVRTSISLKRLYDEGRVVRTIEPINALTVRHFYKLAER